MVVVVVVEQCELMQKLELEQTLAEFDTAGREVEMAAVAAAALSLPFACVVAVMWCGAMAATTLVASVAVEVAAAAAAAAVSGASVAS